MTQQTPETSEQDNDAGSAGFKPGARSEMQEGSGWMTLGLCILIASIHMDRLESLDINPYTIPGLLPGMLGIGMIFLGFLVFIRKWGRYRHETVSEVRPSYDKRAARQRMILVLGLCVVFCIVFLGRGLPFSLTGTGFVTLSILLLENSGKSRQTHRFTPKKIVNALLIGIIASVFISLVFEKFFMLRLP